MAEEARKAEEERLQKAIEAEEQRKREEEERLEAERKAVSDPSAYFAHGAELGGSWFDWDLAERGTGAESQRGSREEGEGTY